MKGRSFNLYTNLECTFSLSGRKPLRFPALHCRQFSPCTVTNLQKSNRRRKTYSGQRYQNNSRCEGIVRCVTETIIAPSQHNVCTLFTSTWNSPRLMDSSNQQQNSSERRSSSPILKRASSDINTNKAIRAKARNPASRRNVNQKVQDQIPCKLRNYNKIFFIVIRFPAESTCL